MLAHSVIKKIKWVGIIVGFSILLFQTYQGFLAFQNQALIFHNIMSIPFTIAIIMFSFPIQVLSYQNILSALGHKVQISELFYVYMISFLPRYIPGSFWGYITRSAFLLDKFSTPPDTAYFSSLIEFLIGIIALVIVSLISLVFEEGFLPTLLISFLLLSASILLGILLKITVRQMAKYRICGFSVPISISSYSIRRWLASISLISINMFLYGLGLNLISISLLGNNHPFLTEISISFPLYYCLSYLTGLLIFIFPSGLGIREVTLSFLLTANLGYTQQQASGIAVIFRLCTLAAEIIWVLLISGHKSINTSRKL